MTLLEFADHLETESRNHVIEACRTAAQSLLQSTPADRPKTRQAIRLEIRGTRGTVGLRFRTKYPTAGTPTLKRFAAQWKGIRSRLREQIIRRINDTLKGN